jgi:hypothetical protein
VDNRDGAHSPVRGIDKALAESGLDDGSRRSSMERLEVDSPLMPTPKKLGSFHVSESVVLKSERSEVGHNVCNPLEMLTLTLNDPENFDYAISLLQNSSNLFDQVSCYNLYARLISCITSTLSEAQTSYWKEWQVSMP